MIGRLAGVLVSKHPPFLLIDVNGVGYEVETPMSTFLELPEIGTDVFLHTHLLVREDAQILYGFLNVSTGCLLCHNHENNAVHTASDQVFKIFQHQVRLIIRIKRN